MRAVVQRVARGSVLVLKENEFEKVAEIGRGLVVLLGVGEDDSLEDAKYLAYKVANMRIFEDDLGRLNKSILEVKKEALVVSQFTLYGDCHQGRRPGFTKAAKAEIGNKLYESFIKELRKLNVLVSTGKFQNYMQVEIINDGPVTVLIDSKKNF